MCSIIIAWTLDLWREGTCPEHPPRSCDQSQDHELSPISSQSEYNNIEWYIRDNSVIIMTAFFHGSLHKTSIPKTIVCTVLWLIYGLSIKQVTCRYMVQYKLPQCVCVCVYVRVRVRVRKRKRERERESCVYLYSNLFRCVSLPQCSGISLCGVKINCDPIRYTNLIGAGVASPDGAPTVIHLVRYTSILQTASYLEKITHHIIKDRTLLTNDTIQGFLKHTKILWPFFKDIGDYRCH